MVSVEGVRGGYLLLLCGDGVCRGWYLGAFQQDAFASLRSAGFQLSLLDPAAVQFGSVPETSITPVQPRDWTAGCIGDGMEGKPTSTANRDMPRTPAVAATNPSDKEPRRKDSGVNKPDTSQSVAGLDGPNARGPFGVAYGRRADYLRDVRIICETPVSAAGVSTGQSHV